MNIKATLLKLNRHWVATAGASLVGLVLVVNTPPAVDALNRLFGSTVTGKIQAVETLVGVVGAAMAYLGRPGTVPANPKDQKP